MEPRWFAVNPQNLGKRRSRVGAFLRRGWLVCAALAILLPSGLAPQPALGYNQTPGLFSQAATESGSAVAADPLVGQIMDKITPATLYTYTAILTGAQPALIEGRLQTIFNRNTYAYSSSYTSGLPLAVAYARAEFQAMGLQVSTHSWNPSNAPNLIAEQPGLPGEDCLYLLTAHLDNMPPATVAPGADDNASGSAGVLTAAQLLSRYSLRCTLRYVLFTGEEQGLWGSAAYALQRKNLGETISGVINLDMIAYNADSLPILDLYVDSSAAGSLELAQTVAGVVSAYGLDLAPDILVDEPLGNFSDNRSFWVQGYPAILVIEDTDDFTPYYHTVEDTIATLNFPYFTAITQAAAGALLHLAELQQGRLEGRVSASADAAPLAGARVRVESPRGDVWTAITNAGGQYEMQHPSGVFTVTAQKEAYFPQVVANAAVPASGTLVVNFSLPVGWRVFLPLQMQ